MRRTYLRSALTLSAWLAFVGCGGGTPTDSVQQPPVDAGGSEIGFDGGSLDTGSNDTGGAPDTTSADTGVVDTGAADTTAADTAVADTFVADTFVADTFVADTSVADTSVADTSVADTTIVDTGVADTSVADTFVADTFGGDTSVADSSTSDGAGEVAVDAGASCTDGIKNGSESDVDCGGPTCGKCPDTGACGGDGDCASGTCLSGFCATTFGSGGIVLVDPPRTSINGAAGTSTVTVGSTTGFVVGQRVVIHQTQGTAATAGQWEEATVTAVGSGTLTFSAPLVNTYSSIGVAKAQVVAFLSYGSVIVRTFTTVRGPAWNGETGGILPMLLKGEMFVESSSSISVSGRGYRGTGHTTSLYRNQNGVEGEGEGRQGNPTTFVTITFPNGAGACGGYQEVGKNGSGGGGGGHATVGSASGPNAYAVPGVCGGSAVGEPTLAKVFFGGAGGEGSADEDGFTPGRGGNGGGFFYLRAPKMRISGLIEATGTSGGDGVQSCTSGCGGSGMAGGGGGAGGTIYLRGSDMVLASGSIQSLGGSAGVGTESNNGGGGSSGRIRIDFDTLNGAAFGTAAATTAVGTSTAPTAHAAKP